MLKSAVSYLRSSTPIQEISIRDQRRVIKKFSIEHGYTIVREFADIAVSAVNKYKKRQQFMDMINFIENANTPISTLFVYDISRFGRSGSDEASYYRHRLRLAGCEITYIAELLPKGNSKNLVRNILEWHKHEEVKQKARDIIYSKVSQAEQGFRPSGKVPYGYKPCFVDGNDAVLKRRKAFIKKKNTKTVLVLDNKERVEIIRRIFEMYTEYKYSMAKIASKLNSEKIPPPSDPIGLLGKYWNNTTISYIIRNPVYAGIACYNRISNGKLYSIKNKKPKDKNGDKLRMPNLEKEWIMVEGAYPQIIEKKQFLKAQEIRKDRRCFVPTSDSHLLKKQVNEEPEYLLSGIVFCGNCGCKMVKFRSNPPLIKKTIGCAFYKCSGYLYRGKSFCKPYSINSKNLDHLTLHVARKQFSRPEVNKSPLELSTSLLLNDGQDSETPTINTKKRFPAILAQELLLSLVKRVTLYFDILKKKAKRNRYQVIDIDIALNAPRDVIRYIRKQIGIEELQSNEKILRFNGNELDNNKESNMRADLDSLLQAFLTAL